MDKELHPTVEVWPSKSSVSNRENMAQSSQTQKTARLGRFRLVDPVPQCTITTVDSVPYTCR